MAMCRGAVDWSVSGGVTAPAVAEEPDPLAADSASVAAHVVGVGG